MGRGSRHNGRLGVIVVGASAGGVDALATAVAGLPADLPAAVLIVLHVSPRGKSVLPHILDTRCLLPVRHAVDGEALEAGRVYVAPPDHHLVVDPGRVRLTTAPRENGVRPSVDVLFRSAALAYGPNVIGVVVSGTLDDGTAGLIAIKQHGGTAVVQDPTEATFPGMPASAARYADPDHIVSLDKLPALLASLSTQARDREPTAAEIPGAQQSEQPSEARAEAQAGELSEFTCPECGGTLWEQREGDLLRFRCRVGHAYSTESLLTQQTDALEGALWAAVVALEERADLVQRLCRRMEDRGRHGTASRFDREAADARRRAGLVREAITHLSRADENSDADA
jgi:two-component system chemotaxis response regulator CheB